MTIKVISTIKPQGVAVGTPGTFPSVEDIDFLGGFQVASNTAAMNAIPAGNRKQGMMVYNLQTAAFYILASDLTTWNTTSINAGVAGGDLTGAFPNPTVLSITGNGTTATVNATNMWWNDTVTSANVGFNYSSSNPNNGANAASVEMFAQNATGTSAFGGSIIMIAGVGTDTTTDPNGSIQLYTNGVGFPALSVGTRINCQVGLNHSFASVPGGSTYSCPDTVNTLLVQTSGGATTINLPALYSPFLGGAGSIVTIKDDQGAASSNPITIQRCQSDPWISGSPDPFIYGNIDGQNNLVLNGSYDSVTLLLGANGWRII